MNNGNRKLPVINIAGAKFYVDALESLLIDTHDKNNTITPKDMLVLDDHMEMLFDKQTRNSKKDNWTVTDNEKYAYVWLYPLEVYDTEGAKIRLGHEGSLIPKNLPVIDIEGVKFLWDDQRTRLLQQDNPYNVIPKSSMDLKDGVMGIYFDTQKKVVPFPHEIKSHTANGGLPPHIRFVPASEINQKVQLAKKPVNHPLPRKKGIRI